MTQSELRPVDWDSAATRSASGVHPAELIAPPGFGQRLAMNAPSFSSPPLQRLAEVVWGVVEYPQEWRDRFEYGVAGTDLAFLALLGGQLGLSMVSPLRLSQVSMDVLGQWDGQPWPYLWVFEHGTFDELVAFWNFRSAASDSNRLASVVGIPRESLTHPHLLEALAIWAGATTNSSLTPRVLANVSSRALPELEAALDAVGIDRLADGETPTRRDPPPETRRPTWLPWDPLPNGRVLRGAWDDAALSVTGGHALVTLPRPRGYRPSGGASLVLQSLPTPLPITPTAAERMLVGGFAHPRGLGINMGSGSPWSLDLHLPDARSALEDWARDHGYTIEEPPAGKDARALLQRLGDFDRLDALVDPLRLEVLVKLAPLTGERVARKLAKEFAPSGDDDSLAEELMERLREEGLLLEINGKTIEQLETGLTEYKQQHPFKRRHLVAALAPLVDAGFVQRGREVKCQSCRFVAFLALHELDEHVRCRGCGQTYLLPVQAPNGEESPTSYRLDGLMARVMERHVLPVILTLRALRDPARYWRPEHVWPGMLFRRDGENELDVDLLASDGTTVFATECKLDARGLGLPQLEKLLAFAERVDATPVVAALEGEFSAEIRCKIDERRGLVLERADLLTIGLPQRTSTAIDGR